MNKSLAFLALASILAVTIFCFGFLGDLKFGYKLEDFFSDDSQEVEFYRKHRKIFGSENSFLLIGLDNQTGVFNPDFLKQVDSMCVALEKFKEVDRVISPTNQRRKLLIPLLGITSLPVLHINDDALLRNDQERIYRTRDQIRAMFSEDTASLLVTLVIPDTINPNLKSILMDDIQECVQSVGFDGLNSGVEVHYAGHISTQRYYIRAMNREIVLFGFITLAMVALFLFVTYRSMTVTLIIIATLIISVILTLALVRINLGQMDFMMTMLPTVLFITGTVSFVHFIASYREKFDENTDKETALRHMLFVGGKATFISSLTTAIGFFSLAFLPVEAISQFGIVVAAGIMITWLLSLLLMAVFIALGKGKIVSVNTGKWEHYLNKSFRIIEGNRNKIMVITLLLLVIAVAGLGRLRLNSHFLDDLSDKSSLKKDLLFFEENFGGIRPFELNILVGNKAQDIFDLRTIRQIEDICIYLEDSCNVSALLSPNSLFKQTHQFLHAGNANYYRIPENKSELREIKKVLTEKRMLELTNGSLMNFSTRHLRIAGRVKDLGSQKMEVLNRRLTNFLAKYQAELDIRITGAAHLMEQANVSVSYYLLQGLLFSLAMVTIVLAFTLRSIKFALLALVPNIVPLIIIGGLMGWMNVDFKISTALIFTVIFGIAVDDTIHFMLRYAVELRINPVNALQNTFVKLGKSLVVTTFILCAGFLCFVFSEFQSTFFAGIYITIALLIALLADLTEIPILIYWTRRNKMSKQAKN